MSLLSYSNKVKKIAFQLNFDDCGIAPATYLDNDARRLEQWLAQGMHGNMHYMENHFELRVDPRKLVPNAQSVITLLKNYYPHQHQNKNIPKISKYAYGKDYHLVIRKQLHLFLQELKNHIGHIEGRGFVDSAPVLERSWAVKSGLGWIGKNGNFIHPKKGSFLFIASLITDVPLLYDQPFAKNHCGNCTRCIDACPTQAILPNNVVQANKCISYFTIELKKEYDIPTQVKGKFDNWIFGCDICQDVCPWNRFATPTHEIEFSPSPFILNLSINAWEKMTAHEFKDIFKESPLIRAKFEGIKRNIQFIQP